MALEYLNQSYRRPSGVTYNTTKRCW